MIGQKRLAHDRITIVGVEPVPLAYDAKIQDGRPLLVQRIGDADDGTAVEFLCNPCA